MVRARLSRAQWKSERDLRRDLRPPEERPCKEAESLEGAHTALALEGGPPGPWGG